MWWMLLVITIATLLSVKVIDRFGHGADGTDVLVTHNREAGRDGQAGTHTQSMGSSSELLCAVPHVAFKWSIVGLTLVGIGDE